MPIVLADAHEHNLRHIGVTIPNGVTAVTGVSGSGKSSLVFDTLYHEAHRRLTELYRRGSATERPTPARVEQIDGLLPAIAVSQNSLNRNPASTLATATGVHPFLRVLYATAGTRTCPACGARLVRSTPDDVVAAVDAGLLLAPLVTGIRGSHATLLRLLSHQHGRDLLVDGAPYDNGRLDPDAPHSVGLVTALIANPPDRSAVRAGIDAVLALGSRVVEHRSGTCSRRWALADVCPGCARPYRAVEAKRFHERCPFCSGAGCDRCEWRGAHPDTLHVTVGATTFAEALALEADAAVRFFASVDLPERCGELRAEIVKRLRALGALGLGYLALNRSAPSLSRGESQRMRLSVCLASRLELLHVLDEPTIGLHARDTGELMEALRGLRGPVVFVEHDPDAVRCADHCIDLGPGAGTNGGLITFEGSPEGLWASDTVSGRHFRGATAEERGPRARRAPRAEADGDTEAVASTEAAADTEAAAPREATSRPATATFLRFAGARANNLAGIDVSILVGRLTVVTGVSGSGKSSLVHGVIAESLRQGRPVRCDSYEGPLLACTLVDQSPIGSNPRSNPATYTKLADSIRDLFAAATGMSSSVFSFNRKEGACPTCSGIGALEVAMRYLPSSWIVCPDCAGGRFRAEALEATIAVDGRRLSIADAFELSVAQARSVFECRAAAAMQKPARTRALRILDTLAAVGLGYLRLGQPSPTLSGGEAQRVKLTKHLARRSLAGELLILDEPSTGLHPANIADLIAGIRALTAAGTTVLIVEHNLDVIRCADWVIDLGPGAGPAGGRLVYQGALQDLALAAQSETGRALRALADRQRIAPEARRDAAIVSCPDRGRIEITGARVNNLNDVSVSIPHRSLTVVTGLSGSGKSSLVRDVLEAQARRRFLETLSLYERQGARGMGGGGDEGASIEGMGVTVAVDPQRVRYNVRATVGTVTEILERLAVLYAASDERDCCRCGGPMRRGESWACPSCGDRMELAAPQDFCRSTYRAACRMCNGVGSLTKPNPEKLIVRPDLPLCAGGMHSPGFFPKGYLCKPFNGGYDVVQAFAAKHGFDPTTTPWNDMSEEAKRGFLYGEPDPLRVLFHNKRGKEQVRTVRFGGFYGWIGEWDVGGTYTDRVTCASCEGSGLRPELRAVKLGGASIDELARLPLARLAGHLRGWRRPEAPYGLRGCDVQAAHATAMRRLDLLCRCGLGYVALDRTEATLSAGEAQRARLAGLLGSGLTGLTVVLDEPSRGLHPVEVAALVDVARDLRDEGNTVVVVEHEAAFVDSADHVIEMGPGAGLAGGTVVYAGPPSGLIGIAESATGRARRDRTGLHGRRPRREPAGWCRLVGARENNLAAVDVRFPYGSLTGVCGVSGSGKSSLVVDTLGRILAPIRHTTSVAHEPIEPGAHDRVEDPPDRAIVLDQSRGTLGTPSRFLGLDLPLARLFATAPDALDRGLCADDLLRPCTACGGVGRIRHEMGFLPAVHAVCETCDGIGLPEELHSLSVGSISLARLRSMTLEEIVASFPGDEAIARAAGPAIELGLGYLASHQPPHTLSGGEAQRLKIAAELRRPRADWYILDEPTVGLHREDVTRLVGVLHRLVDAGRTVLVVEHHPDLLAACDWLIELGPGGGPEGGRLIAEGPPETVAALRTPTAPYLAAALGAVS